MNVPNITAIIGATTWLAQNFEIFEYCFLMTSPIFHIDVYTPGTQKIAIFMMPK